MTTTTTHSFSLFLRGADVLDDDALEALFEAGCDDATFGATDGNQYAAFHREDSSFARAVMTAIDAVEGAVEGVLVVGISGSSTEHADFIAALNGALAVRCRAGRVQQPEERQALAHLVEQITPVLQAGEAVSE